MMEMRETPGVKEFPLSWMVTCEHRDDCADESKQCTVCKNNTVAVRQKPSHFEAMDIEVKV